MITTIHIESALDLNLIAAYLEGLEETIIYKLIDRAQFAENRVAYQRGTSGFEGAGDVSLFDLRLRRQEEMDVEFGRFCVPEERPFRRDLARPKREVRLPPSCLNIEDYNAVNVTDRILSAWSTTYTLYRRSRAVSTLARSTLRRASTARIQRRTGSWCDKGIEKD
jgi:hypothetical protein